MSVRGLLLDLAGVVYTGAQAIPGAVAAIGRLHDRGLPMRFVTNTSRQTRAMLVARLATLGLEVSPGDVFTAPRAGHQWLSLRGLRPALLIHPALAPEFADLDTRDPNAVFVGDAADGFRYEALNTVFRLLKEGAPLVAVGRNRYFREADGLSLDAGPFVAALEYAAGVEAVIVGKPAPEFFGAAVRDLGLAPAEVLMVGDDVEADVIGARDAGLQAALVRTGKYIAGDERRSAGVDASCIDSLAEIETLI